MCGSHHEHRRRHRFGRFGNREQWLSRLEEYQRDLEQEVADVADLIKHLRGNDAPQQATQTV